MILGPHMRFKNLNDRLGKKSVHKIIVLLTDLALTSTNKLKSIGLLHKKMPKVDIGVSKRCSTRILTTCDEPKAAHTDNYMSLCQ